MSGKSEVPAKQLRVLIADDAAAIRDSLGNLLSRVEHLEVVGRAETGIQALDMIRALKPDVATLDIRMPGMTGIKVLEAVRREKLPVSVIMLSGLDDTEYRRKCLELGAQYFFHKATEFEMVVKVLEEQASALNGPKALI